MITVDIKDYGELIVQAGITLWEISKLIPERENPIILAKVNQHIDDLIAPVTMDCQVEFLDITDREGFRAYQRSTSFLMIYAAKSILGKKARIVIEHSINKNYYCEIYEPVEITDELLEQIENKMREIAEQGLIIEKLALPVDQGLKIAEELGLDDKISLLKYRRSSNVNFYKLDWFYDYFYGQMIPSTGLIGSFKLLKRSKGFLLQFPSPDNANEMSELTPHIKISEVFAESNEWARILNADTVGALNNLICEGKLSEIIRINEALHEKKIAYLADQIHQEKKNIVLIAGPSSSGKTTFAQRLCVQMRVNGLRPSVINLDDYFVERALTPRDDEGNYDYETVDAIDLERLNEDLNNLLKGEEVQLPQYNFIDGTREYKGRIMRLKPDDVLIIEGIHGLNERLTELIPHDKKFKIFVSALTQLNIDDHNRIATTDSRLIRRIVRDHRARGADALHTINMWMSVLRGENKYIFPFQEEADGFFNSALIYEMCILKQFAEPLLFNVKKNAPEYTEARRLIKFLDTFLGVSSEHVVANSILREFIGGSCF
ncbi:MAG: nucleoside kinase [Clostridiales bacterium]|jgi:uridine kinase|nr:nucleoside kinase [Clostridiales bacterium]